MAGGLLDDFFRELAGSDGIGDETHTRGQVKIAVSTIREFYDWQGKATDTHPTPGQMFGAHIDSSICWYVCTGIDEGNIYALPVYTKEPQCVLDVYKFALNDEWVLVRSRVDPRDLITMGLLQEGDIVRFHDSVTGEQKFILPILGIADSAGLFFIGSSLADEIEDDYDIIEEKIGGYEDGYIDDDEEDDDECDCEEEEEEDPNGDEEYVESLQFIPAGILTEYLMRYKKTILRCRGIIEAEEGLSE